MSNIKSPSGDASVPDWARAVLPNPSDQSNPTSNQTGVAPRGSALTTNQKMLQLQLIQRQYAHHSDMAHSLQAAALATSANVSNSPHSLESLSAMSSDGTGVDLASITSKALTKAHTKRRPPNAHVQHYDEDAALTYDASLTPRTLFDRKRKTIARLTITLIMQLNIEQIRAIRADFDSYPDGVNMSQFVHIMTKHVYSPSLSFCPSPSLFLQSLVELFESMDLDGDQSLEWEELLSTIVHMGMGATDHLVLSPINIYRDGPVYTLTDYFASKMPCDRHISYHSTLQKLIYYEKDDFILRIYDPAMRNPPIQPKIGQGSVLCCEYVAQYGKMDEMKIGGDDRKTDQSSSQSTQSDDQANDQTNIDQSNSQSYNSSNNQSNNQSSKQSISQSISHSSKIATTRKQENEKKKADSFAFYKNALLLNQSKKSTNPSISQSFNQSMNPANKQSMPRKSVGGGQWLTDPHSDEVYYAVKERSPGARFGNDDLLITATAQYLSLWEGLPAGEPTLCDSKKVKSPFSAVTWCPLTQRLFTGDVHGGVISWKIINAVSVENLSSHNRSNNQPNKQSGNQSQSSWHPSSLARLTTVPKLVKERSFSGHTDVVTKIVTIPSMTFVLTASLDNSVRMFDINTGHCANVFQSHRAGVIDLSYSNEYRFLLSASIDHDVCVWSPFAEQVVFKLIGHTAPLVGVQFVTGTPQIITADCEGWIKIWDARNFTCCQTFMSAPQILAIAHTGERHARMFVTSRSSQLRAYDQEGGPYLKATDDDPIYCVMYSELSLSFLTCNRHDIKLWNALNGRLSRVYRGLSDHPISAICFDARQRKLFVGDKLGKIRVYNALTGAYMKSLAPHSDEIVFLQYIQSPNGARELVSAAADRTIRVHDERPIEEQIVKLEVKLENGCEIIAVAINAINQPFTSSSHLSSPLQTTTTLAGVQSMNQPLESLPHHPSLFAVASSDGRIGVWNMENGMRDEINKNIGEGLTCLTFLAPYALLIVGDEAAHLTAYHTRPSHIKGEVAFAFSTNSAREEIVGAISTLKWDESNHVLYVGNIHGQVLAYDIGPLIQTVQQQIHVQRWDHSTPVHNNKVNQSHNPPANVSTPRSLHQSVLLSNLSNQQTSHHQTPKWTSRHRKTPFTWSEMLHSSPYVTEPILTLCSTLQPRWVIQAHTNAISSITLTQCPAALLTTARMHGVKIWSTLGKLIGTMDSQAALAASYASHAPGETNDQDGQDWNFVVDVSAKEHQEMLLSEMVLSELEEIQKQEKEQELNATLDSSAAPTNNASKQRSKARIEAESWLPVSWQQAMKESDDAAVNDPSSAAGLVQLVTKEHVDDQQAEHGIRQLEETLSNLTSVRNSQSNSHSTNPTSRSNPTVRFDFPSPKSVSSMRQSDGVELPSIRTDRSSVVEREEEKEALIYEEQLILPPINQSIKQSNNQSISTKQTIKQSKTSNRNNNNNNNNNNAKANVNKFSYKKTPTAPTSFSLGLTDNNVRLSSSQLAAAKLLQDALQAAST